MYFGSVAEFAKSYRSEETDFVATFVWGVTRSRCATQFCTEPLAASSRSPGEGGGGVDESFTSVQCIDQIKEALQLQKTRKKT